MKETSREKHRQRVTPQRKCSLRPHVCVYVRTSVRMNESDFSPLLLCLLLERTRLIHHHLCAIVEQMRFLECTKRARRPEKEDQAPTTPTTEEQVSNNLSSTSSSRIIDQQFMVLDHVAIIYLIQD